MMVKVRKVEKWVAMPEIPAWLASDEPALAWAKEQIVAEGTESLLRQGLEPTGESTAEVIEATFPGRDPYSHLFRVIVYYFGAEEEVSEEGLVS